MTRALDARDRPPELDHRRFVRAERPHVAVIDIGSNSVRLVVYDQHGRAPFPRFNEKSLCRLGAGIDADGRLRQSAIDHTLRALGRFGAIAAAMEVETIHVLATEAVRRAPNGGEIIKGAKRLGLEVGVLDGRAEAHYSALGVVAGFFRPRGLMGDIGGGSLEIAEVLDDRPGERWVSMPLGALPVSAMLAEGYDAAKKRVDAILAESLPPATGAQTFYAVGGGWRALARIQIARAGSLSKVAHGFEMDARELRTLAKRVAKAAPEEIAALPDAPSRRTDTLAAGALALDRTLKMLKPDRVAFSALGLREGWLYAALPEAERRLDPLLEGAQVFGAARARVPAFAEALARWTEGLFPGENSDERRLRLAACALSDIAWRDHANIRAEECFRRLLQLPFIGVRHDERAFLAAALHARHSGKSDDPVLGGARSLLSASGMKRAQVLGRALQLAYRVSGSVPAILDRTRLVVGRKAVIVEVQGGEGAPDSDAVHDRLRQLAKALGAREAELRVI